MGELSRKARLNTSLSLEFDSECYPSTESQPDFALDTTNEKITPKPNLERWRTALSSARGMTNNRLQPRRVNDVVPRKPQVGYENKLVSFVAPVEDTPELLRASRWFCRNSFCNRRGVGSVSLVKHLYTVSLPESHRAHICVSRDHLLQIRKALWPQVLFNILKERRILHGEVARRLKHLWIVRSNMVEAILFSEGLEAMQKWIHNSFQNSKLRGGLSHRTVLCGWRIWAETYHKELVRNYFGNVS